MTILTWAIRLVILAILLVFAIQNTEPVSLRFLTDYVWQAPLVIVLLIFFATGFVFGALALVGVIYRQRREISRLKNKPELPLVANPPTPPHV